MPWPMYRPAASFYWKILLHFALSFPPKGGIGKHYINGLFPEYRQGFSPMCWCVLCLGKTVTLQKLAESLSEIGVPVFMADVKGDLTGIAQERRRKNCHKRLKISASMTGNRMPIRWWCGIPLARKGCPRDGFRPWGFAVAGAAVESQRCTVWRAEYHLPH